MLPLRCAPTCPYSPPRAACLLRVASALWPRRYAVIKFSFFVERRFHCLPCTRPLQARRAPARSVMVLLQNPTQGEAPVDALLHATSSDAAEILSAASKATDGDTARQRGAKPLAHVVC